MNKNQKIAKIMYACAQVMDADELAEVVELMNDSVPAPTVEKTKKNDNGTMAAILKMLAKDADDDEDKPKEEAKDSHTLDARISRIEQALDAIVQGMTAKDSDDDEEDDGKATAEDADGDEGDSDKDKKEAADAALKTVMDGLKPFFLKLPEKHRKPAKVALREHFGKKSTLDAYAVIAKNAATASAAAAQVTDSDKMDYRALGEKIAEHCNPNYSSMKRLTADSLK